MTRCWQCALNFTFGNEFSYSGSSFGDFCFGGGGKDPFSCASFFWRLRTCLMYLAVWCALPFASNFDLSSRWRSLKYSRSSRLRDALSPRLNIDQTHKKHFNNDQTAVPGYYVRRIGKEDNRRRCGDDDHDGPETQVADWGEHAEANLNKKCDISQRRSHMKKRRTWSHPGVCVLHLKNSCSSLYTWSPTRATITMRKANMTMIHLMWTCFIRS